MSEPPVVLCDLDGVVWLAREPLPRAAEAVELLRSRGHRVLFVTNNSFATLAEQQQYLSDVGISADGDVLTSALSAASLIDEGMRVLVCGGAGLIEAVAERGASPVEAATASGSSQRFDSVVVGFHRSFDYESLRMASDAIRSGASFIAANEDPTYPTPSGPIPGGGSIVAAIATASGAVPRVAGKPHPPMAALVRARVPVVRPDAVMIGDRHSTDGRFAAELGCRFALVRSQISSQDHRPENGGSADFEGDSLWEVASLLVESSGSARRTR